jgi:transcriptional regulator with XRE-family HTH domain
MELTVGIRLKKLRERVGISQRELARRSGQSPAAISAIELDKVSPSIETLKNLLDALGEQLADFFSVGTEAWPEAFFGPENMVEVRLGPIHYRQIGQSFRRDGVQIVRTRAHPGSDTGIVSHQARDNEIGFVLAGQIEVTINGQSRVLGAGEGYAMRGGETIRIRNRFDEPCDYVFVSAPEGLQTARAADGDVASKIMDEAGRQRHHRRTAARAKERG